MTGEYVTQAPARSLPFAAGGQYVYTVAELEELAALITPEWPVLRGRPDMRTEAMARNRARVLQLALRRIGCDVRTRTWPTQPAPDVVLWCWCVYDPGLTMANGG